MMVLGSAGCGDSRIVLSVDVDSFLAEDDRETDYTVPALGTLPTIFVGPQDVQLPEGTGALTDVEEADLDLRVMVDNVTGTGSMELRLYFSETSDDLFATEPVAIFQADLVPGETAVIEETVPLADEVEAIFEENSLQFGFDIRISGTASPDILTGTVMVEEIGVRVVSDPALGL